MTRQFFHVGVFPERQTLVGAKILQLATAYDDADFLHRRLFSGAAPDRD
jgi:hypothetical protein